MDAADLKRLKAAGLVKEGRSVGEALKCSNCWGTKMVVVASVYGHPPEYGPCPRCTEQEAAPCVGESGFLIRLRLPFPPSTNTYWRAIPLFKAGKFIRVKVLISERGRLYRRAVVRSARQAVPFGGRLAVDVILHPPTRHRRDVDNFGGKALLDSLKYAGVYHDDSQIDDLRVRRGRIVEGGYVDVRLSRIPDAQPGLFEGR
jgi:crossover junction endodeoxyribonuclease RusA